MTGTKSFSILFIAEEKNDGGSCKKLIFETEDITYYFFLRIEVTDKHTFISAVTILIPSQINSSL